LECEVCNFFASFQSPLVNKYKGPSITGRRDSGESSPAVDRLDQLLRQAKEGNAEAFQELYRSYGKKILNYVYRMTRSRDEAEDLTQDTFVLAYRNLKSLKENARFQSWLFRIAQNNIYQRYRNRPPETESVESEEIREFADQEGTTEPFRTPEQAFLSQELEQIVQTAIDDLPDKYRQVFVLSAIHKLSYREISEVMSRSLASVKSDIHRARVEVREKIKGYLGENYGLPKLF